jgi:hypothetical protein
VNFTKVDSLYCEGLKPLMYSDKVMETTGIGWHRCGSKIAYFRNEPEYDQANVLVKTVYSIIFLVNLMVK